MSASHVQIAVSSARECALDAPSFGAEETKNTWKGMARSPLDRGLI